MVPVRLRALARLCDLALLLLFGEASLLVALFGGLARLPIAGFFEVPGLQRALPFGLVLFGRLSGLLARVGQSPGLLLLGALSCSVLLRSLFAPFSLLACLLLA